MTKMILRALLLVLLSQVFITCKKGPEDPSLSLRTRKNRLVGYWRMKSGSAGITIEETGNSPFAQSHQFDGSHTMINETQSGSVIYVYKAVYLLSIEFKKDGTFTLNETYTGKPLSATGKWNFTGRVGEAKNKEEVICTIDQVSQGFTDGHIFNCWGSEFKYKIIGLHDKELIVQSVSKPYLESNGDNITIETHYRFEQNKTK